MRAKWRGPDSLERFGDDERAENLRGAWSRMKPPKSRRWRRIVFAVLPEIPDLDRAFEDFGILCASLVLALLCRRGTPRCSRSRLTEFPW